MKCPKCQAEMTSGKIAIEDLFDNLFLKIATIPVGGIGGSSLSQLCFREPNREPVTIMTGSQSMLAQWCQHCEGFLIMNDLTETESECVVCHTIMPAGVTQCVTCGWTYEMAEGPASHSLR